MAGSSGHDGDTAVFGMTGRTFGIDAADAGRVALRNMAGGVAVDGWRQDQPLRGAGSGRKFST